jgi:hypothetical protein
MRLLTSLLLAGLMVPPPSAPKTKLFVVAPSGTSVLERTISGHLVTVHFLTHETKLPERSANFPFDWPSVCTGSRNPCALLDNLSIRVDGKDVFIARSAYADCSDLHTSAVTAKGNIYTLVLGGGDAGESYMVFLKFSGDRLTERTLVAGEDTSHVLEQTTYDLMH